MISNYLLCHCNLYYIIFGFKTKLSWYRNFFYMDEKYA
jgi:hypothetical protein